MRVLLAACFTVCLLTSGCTPDAAFSEADAALASIGDFGDRVDIHFYPADLRLGESVVAATDQAVLESTATKVGHQVQLTAPGRRILRVTGLLDGDVQASADGLGTPAEGGTTKTTPTSVHTVRACDAAGCTTSYEYDYDLHDPDGDGSTEWTTPDGEQAIIDRLRFVVETDQADPSNDRVTVSASEPLRFVR